MRDLVVFLQFIKRKNTHGEVIILVKINTPPWVLFNVFKIVQMVPNRAKCIISSKLATVPILLEAQTCIWDPSNINDGDLFETFIALFEHAFAGLGYINKECIVIVDL